jgi:hypothetical protein
MDEPIPHLAWWIMRNAMREVVDMPEAVARFSANEEITSFLMAPLPIPLEKFMAVYEKVVVPRMDEALNSLNEHVPLIVYHNGNSTELRVPIYTQARSETRRSWNEGEPIVFNGRPGRVVRVRPDGRYDIEVRRLSAPTAVPICDREAKYFSSVRDLFGVLGAGPKPFQVVNKIVDKLFIANIRCGLRLVESTKTGDNVWVVEGRLGMAAIGILRGPHEICLTAESGELFRQYCESQRGIIEGLAKEEPLTIATAFKGNVDEAQKLARWIEEQVRPKERPLLTHTLSAAGIKGIEGLIAEIQPMPVIPYEGVTDAELLVSLRPPTKHHLGQCYISLDPDSFGAVGYLVGYSTRTGDAAFVQESESTKATTFGGFLQRRTGIVTKLDSLITLSNS